MIAACHTNLQKTIAGSKKQISGVAQFHAEAVEFAEDLENILCVLFVLCVKSIKLKHKMLMIVL